MKKYNVKFMEYVPKPGKCVKAIVQDTDSEGKVIEKELYSRTSFIYNESKIVSVQEISIEEYNEWISRPDIGYSGIGL